MKHEDRNGSGSGSAGDPNADPRTTRDARHARTAGQAAEDADQSLSDADQTSADADQTGSTIDQTMSDSDQRASDRDQESSDRDHATGTSTAAEDTAYEASRGQREIVSFERLSNRLRRSDTARDRDDTASRRDRIADARDEAGRARDARAEDDARALADPEASLLWQLEALAAEAAVDRARAAADRARAAEDRASAARDRARLEAELDRAHLDELTGAYRRQMGRMALSNEIDRARRSDGRFVLAFVDVDGMKGVNDRDGHAAGDRVLQTVVRAIRERLRSFDPIVRHGGDEFVCGLGGTDIAEATHRFDAIAHAIQSDAGVGISVGLAALEAGDTPDQLTERADAAMLEVKKAHQALR